MPATAQLNATFAALADPTRRAILARLALGEATVSELAEPFAMSQPAVSKHLKVLEIAGLVSSVVDAQRRPRQLQAAPLKAANDWLEQYRQLWEARFEQLDVLLAEMKSLQGAPALTAQATPTTADRKTPQEPAAARRRTR